MKITRLKNRFLSGAILISVLLAGAYTLAASWVISQQYQNQARDVLHKAATLINDNLGEQRLSLLTVSRQLANQGNLGTTLWFLTRYADTGIDEATLTATYQQLVGDTWKAGRTAEADQVLVYNSQGKLVSFALLDKTADQFGYAQPATVPIFNVASAPTGAGASANLAQLRKASKPANLAEQFDGPLPQREKTVYTVVGGQLAIQTQVPVQGLVFDEAVGTEKLSQEGLVVMTRLLDSAMLAQWRRLTDTDINVFTGNNLTVGSVPAYSRLTRSDVVITGAAATRESDLAEDIVNREGYYQYVVPLGNGQQAMGSLAILRSRQITADAIRQTVHILLFIAGVSLLLSIPFAMYLASSISGPLSALIRIFRRVAHDPEDHLVQQELVALKSAPARLRELAVLTDSFIAMNDAIGRKINQVSSINASLERTVEERTAALSAREREFRSLTENSPDTVARYNAQCQRIYVNPAFATQFAGGAAALLGKSPSQSPGGIDAEIYEAHVLKVFETGQLDQFELKWPGLNDQLRVSHIRLAPEKNQSGEVMSVLAIGRDITERIEFEDMVWKQANFDLLTGLPNRQMFHDRLDHEARVCHRNGQNMVLMLIDLDHFKEVNDTLGHDKGDVLLVEAARRIGSCVRESDTVARLGGDEFTVILSGRDAGFDAAAIDRVAEDILKALTEPFRLDDLDTYVSASLGITLYPQDAQDLDTLFKNADQAMYRAKNNGRNRYSYFTADLHEQAQRRMRLISDMRAALAAQQFRVYYQPIVDLTDGQIFKAEALIRWQHPSLGMIEPGQFITVAEDTGLIIPMGDWVFEQALNQVNQWRCKYRPDFQISVNKSPVQIRQADKTSSGWVQHLEQHQFPGNGICIEITEGLLLNTEPGTLKKLREYRAAGIQVAIDDFGTGYSSLTYLKKFNIDYLKIDRVFIAHLETDANDQALCEAIIVMAHKLGLKVIAEGVETDGQRRILQHAGCDYAQGFFYGHPVPPEEFETRWLAAGH